MDNTFITIHRKLLTSTCFTDGELLKVWLWCLLRANYKDTEVIHDGQIISLKRGQFITGRFKACSELGMSHAKYRKRMQTLGGLRQISVKTTNKYSIITVLKYSDYQDKDKKTTNRKPTESQQKATDNKVNKVNNMSETSVSDGGEPLKDKKNNMSFKNMRRYKGEEGGYEEVAVQTDPDYSPKKKTDKKVLDDVQAVFDLFNNPASALWRMREIERVAAQALYETYGLEKLKVRVQRIQLEAKNKDPLFPLITTPSQLLDKMPNVERYLNV